MAWLWWVGGALALGVVEMLSVDLIFLMLAGGALGAAVAAALGAPFWIQVIVFAAVSTLLLVAVRPWAKAHLAATTPEMRTNVHRLVGEEATVLSPVDTHPGRVRLGGEEWSARCEGPGSGPLLVLAAGQRVRVTRIDGAVAVVEPVQS